MSTPAGPERPKSVKPRIKNVPAELKQLDQWLVWRYVKRVDTQRRGEIRWDKVPFKACDGTKASSTDPGSWSSFRRAWDAYLDSQDRQKPFDGIGFVFTVEDPFVFIDIDDVDSLSDEEWGPVDEFLNSCGSYTELSVSRRGIHVIALGQVPGERNRKGKFEFYDRSRYAAITGDVEGDNTEIRECDEALGGFYRSVFPEPEPRPPSTPASNSAPFDTDADLLDRARKARNGDAFSALYDDGDTSGHGGDDSAADMALASHLVWWTGHDLDRADRLFRRSALMRQKWDERHSGDGRTYGQMTLEAANNSVQGGYGPPASRVAGLDPSLPVIPVNAQMRDTIDGAMEALSAMNEPPFLFRQELTIVEVVTADGVTRIKPVSTARLTEVLSRAANWVSTRARGAVASSPPANVVRAIEEKASEFPELRGVTDLPILRADGSFFTDAGYDGVTGLYLTRDARHLIDANAPTKAAAMESATRLTELIGDFPFADNSSRANAFAALFTPFVRPLITGPVPLFLIDKPSPGTGATLLAQVVSFLGIGELPGMMSLSPSDIELEKAIFATLAGGARMVVIDNVNVPVNHPSLAMALTANAVTSRRLGHSSMGTAPNLAVWIMTANNASLGDDIARRTVYIRLDARSEMPHLRTHSRFRHPRLMEHVREERDAYIRDIGTAVRYWIALGKPPGSGTVLGMFESWCETLQGILEAVGVTHFLQNKEVVYRQVDTSHEEWADFLAAVIEVFGVSPFITRDLLVALESHPALREAAPHEVTNALSEHEPAVRLGHVLRKQRDRVFGDWRLEACGTANTRVRQWRVCSSKRILTAAA